MNKTLFFILIFLINSITLFSQVKKAHNKKLYNDCVKYFMNEEFEKAFPMLLELDSLEPDNSEIKYYIGVCYLNKNNYNDRITSISYLEPVIKENKLAFPPDVYKDLAELYHEKMDFKNAEVFYRKYQQLALFEEQQESNIKQLSDYTRNAKKITKLPVNVKLKKLEEPINTYYDETNLFYCETNNSIYFNRIIYKYKTRLDSIVFFLTFNFSNNLLDTIIIENNEFINNCRLAGISTDANHIFLNKSKDLYSSEFSENKIHNINALTSINTLSNENYITSSSDMKNFYFSSDMPGGNGGFDIYYSTIDDKGNWSKAKNLGTKINSKNDEIIPIFNEATNSLYYSSNGLSSIGHYDVFKTTMTSPKIWTKYINIGYPINTTINDLFYSIHSKQSKAFIIKEDHSNYLNNEIYEIIFEL